MCIEHRFKFTFSIFLVFFFCSDRISDLLGTVFMPLLTLWWQPASTEKTAFFTNSTSLDTFSLVSRIDLVSKNLLANCLRNFGKKDLKKTAIRKVFVKRLSNKYGKNSKNKKFNKILHLEREEVKKGFEKSANFAKIAKVTRLFLAMWKDWVINMAKIARIINSTIENSTLTKREGQEELREVREFRKNRKSNKTFSCYVKRLSNKYGKNSKNNKFYNWKFYTYKKRGPRRASRSPRISQKSQK